MKGLLSTFLRYLEGESGVIVGRKLLERELGMLLLTILFFVTFLLMENLALCVLTCIFLNLRSKKCQ